MYHNTILFLHSSILKRQKNFYAQERGQKTDCALSWPKVQWMHKIDLLRQRPPRPRQNLKWPNSSEWWRITRSKVCITGTCASPRLPLQFRLLRVPHHRLAVHFDLTTMATCIPMLALTTSSRGYWLKTPAFIWTILESGTAAAAAAGNLQRQLHYNF